MEVTRATLALIKLRTVLASLALLKTMTTSYFGWRDWRQLVPHLVELTAQLPANHSASSQDEVVAERGSKAGDCLLTKPRRERGDPEKPRS